MTATPPPRTPRRRGRSAVLAVAAAAAVGTTTLAAATIGRDAAGGGFGSKIAVPAAAAAGHFAVGPDQPQATIDVSIEYGCPGCADALIDASAALERARLDGLAQIRFHLSGSTPDAARAANAVACMTDTGVEAAAAYYMAVLPDTQEKLTDDRLLEAASRMTTDSPAFTACVKHGTYRTWVSQQPKHPRPVITVDGAAVTATELTERFDR